MLPIQHWSRLEHEAPRRRGAGASAVDDRRGGARVQRLTITVSHHSKRSSAWTAATPSQARMPPARARALQNDVGNRQWGLCNVDGGEAVRPLCASSRR